MSYWLLLTLICTLLFVLPLVPALLEWRLKRDADPLRVVRAYDGNIKHFANSFRHFLGERFPELMHGGAPAAPGAAPSRLADESYQIVEADSPASFLPAELEQRSCARMLIGPAALKVSDGMFFEKEVYAGAALSGGEGNSFRAILACGDIELGADSAILRWAHSDASISLGERARLYGRISADQAISLQRTTRFGRMSAPVIRFGPAPAAPERPLPTPACQALARPRDLIDETQHRWLVSGKLDIPAATFHNSALVAHKDISIGDYCRINADIKSNGDLYIGAHVRIEGSVVATGTIYVGPGCYIKGPIVGDRRVIIETGTVIGLADTPTTVTAAEIRVEEGVVAHGTVWARELGFVSAAYAEAS